MPVRLDIQLLNKEHNEWLEKSNKWFIRSWQLKNIDKEIALLKSKKYLQKASYYSKKVCEVIERDGVWESR
jgi:hypothetical protein